ncbi:MAG: ABC transporter permease [Bacteroidales bacterium]|jgi:hypothetical protein|nr:ABC transporter permease [Bacteroidales bacterium]
MLSYLLGIEILKLKRNRSFWILLVLFVLGVFGVNNLVRVASDANMPFKFFSFPEVWQNVVCMSRFLLVIPGLIVIMHTCAEHTYRTHRQNVIDGLSRGQYVTAKILFIVAMALFSTAVIFLTALFLGWLSGSEISFQGFRYVLYSFVQSLSCMGLAFLFALLFKRSAVVTGIFFSYVFIFKNVLEHYLNKLGAGDFVPLISSDNLTPIANTFVRDLIRHDYKPEGLYLALSLLYIILFYSFCYYRYKKQDL